MRLASLAALTRKPPGYRLSYPRKARWLRRKTYQKTRRIAPGDPWKEWGFR